MQTPQIFNEETGDYEELPWKWSICPPCNGHGKSSAYLGAFTGTQMREDPDFFADYMAGHYDKPCPDCGGAGKIKIADRKRMTKEQKRAWSDELEWRAEQRAEERAEYRMSAEYLAEMKGGY